MQNESTCAICLQDIECNTEAIIPQCNHEFCVDCIKNWIYMSESCPLDRCKIESIFVSSLYTGIVNIPVSEIVNEFLLQGISENNTNFDLFFNNLSQALTDWILFQNELKLNFQNDITKIQEIFSKNKIKCLYELLHTMFARFDKDYFIGTKTEFISLETKLETMTKRAQKHNLSVQNINLSPSQEFVARTITDLFINLTDNANSMKRILESNKLSFDSEFENLTEQRCNEIYYNTFIKLKLVWNNIDFIDHKLWSPIKSIIIKDIKLINQMSILFQEIKLSNCVVCNQQIQGESHCKFTNCQHSVCMKCVHNYSIHEGYCPIEIQSINHWLYLYSVDYEDIFDYWNKNLSKTLWSLQRKLEIMIMTMKESNKNDIILVDKFIETFQNLHCQTSNNNSREKFKEICDEIILSGQFKVLELTTKKYSFDVVKIKKFQYLTLEKLIYNYECNKLMLSKYTTDYHRLLMVRDVLITTMYSMMNYLNTINDFDNDFFHAMKNYFDEFATARNYFMEMFQI